MLRGSVLKSFAGFFFFAFEGSTQQGFSHHSSSPVSLFSVRVSATGPYRYKADFAPPALPFEAAICFYFKKRRELGLAPNLLFPPAGRCSSSCSRPPISEDVRWVFALKKRSWDEIMAGMRAACWPRLTDHRGDEKVRVGYILQPIRQKRKSPPFF